MTKTKQPVKRCSDWCGHGCTEAEYQAAQKSALLLCTNLLKQDTTKQYGWRPDVWENMGWHFAAISQCGRIKVHSNGPGRRFWTAFLGGRWAENGSSPARAVAAVLDAARSALLPYADLLVTK